MTSRLLPVLLLAAGLLGGCVAPEPRPDAPMHAPVLAVPAAAPAATDGSAFRPGSGLALFSDRRASRVGDIIVIALEERTTASKSSDASFSKESSTELEDPTLFGKVLDDLGRGIGLGASVESSNEFNGSADAGQSNRLDGTIAVTVTAVYPNGTLVVSGEKWVQINRGQEFLRVTGLVRPEDVGPDNQVSSQLVANARIAFSGTGALADSSRAGWLTRLFNNPVWPF